MNSKTKLATFLRRSQAVKVQTSKSSRACAKKPDEPVGTGAALIMVKKQLRRDALAHSCWKRGFFKEVIIISIIGQARYDLSRSGKLQFLTLFQ
jgi:hypothetical protein